MDKLQEARHQAGEIVDEGLSVASDNLRSTAAFATQHVQTAAGDAASAADTAFAAVRDVDARIFSGLKDGVRWCYENPWLSVPAATTLALLALPGPRAVLLRNSVRRFTSEESRYKAAEVRAARLSEFMNLQQQEQKKLQERAHMAWDEMQRGRNKLRAATQQLQGVVDTLVSKEHQAEALLQDLRQIRSKQVLKLRGDVSSQLHAARSRRKTLENLVYDYERKL